VIATGAPSPTVFPTGSAGRVEVHEFAGLGPLSPSWDMSYTQLGRGKARSRATFAHTARMELVVVSRFPGVLMVGAPPPGMAVVALNLQGAGLHLQRDPWERGVVGVARSGDEFEIISPASHTLFGLCVDQGRLDEATEEHWGRRFPARAPGPGVHFRDDASRRRLIATWSRWLHRATRRQGLPADQQALMEQEVIGALLDGVEPGFRTPPMRRRRDVAVRAEAFLRRCLDEPIQLNDVCSIARVSRPVLHASFRAEFGFAPMAYWKSLRLSAARRGLERAGPGTTVAEVATRWGFYRLGYFSGDYRSMFGEMPSETLRRARDHREEPRAVALPQ